MGSLGSEWLRSRESPEVQDGSGCRVVIPYAPRSNVVRTRQDSIGKVRFHCSSLTMTSLVSLEERVWLLGTSPNSLLRTYRHCPWR